MSAKYMQKNVSIATAIADSIARVRVKPTNIPSKINAVEEVIEQGYDTEKQMRYYKIYYTSEK